MENDMRKPKINEVKFITKWLRIIWDVYLKYINYNLIRRNATFKSFGVK